MSAIPSGALSLWITVVRRGALRLGIYSGGSSVPPNRRAPDDPAATHLPVKSNAVGNPSDRCGNYRVSKAPRNDNHLSDGPKGRLSF